MRISRTFGVIGALATVLLGVQVPAANAEPETSVANSCSFEATDPGYYSGSCSFIPLGATGLAAVAAAVGNSSISAAVSCTFGNTRGLFAQNSSDFTTYNHAGLCTLYWNGYVAETDGFISAFAN